MERPKHRLQIIVDDSRSRTEEHAKQAIRHLDKAQWQGYHNVNPMNISVQIALFPNHCDDCGDLFWANDQYATHPKCKKGTSGFGFG